MSLEILSLINDIKKFSSNPIYSFIKYSIDYLEIAKYQKSVEHMEDEDKYGDYDPVDPVKLRKIKDILLLFSCHLCNVKMTEANIDDLYVNVKQCFKCSKLICRECSIEEIDNMNYIYCLECIEKNPEISVDRICYIGNNISIDILKKVIYAYCILTNFGI